MDALPFLSVTPPVYEVVWERLYSASIMILEIPFEVVGFVNFTTIGFPSPYEATTLLEVNLNNLTALRLSSNIVYLGYLEVQSPTNIVPWRLFENTLPDMSTFVNDRLMAQ